MSTEVKQLSVRSISAGRPYQSRFGQLYHFDIEMEDGTIGEYSGKTPDSGAKNFPTGQRRTYRVEQVAKAEGKSAIKFSPARANEIVQVPPSPVGGTAQPAPSASAPVHTMDSTAQRIQTSVAFKAAVDLAVAGKIELKQIEVSTKKFNEMLTRLNQ